jgi:hypothetical protein
MLDQLNHVQEKPVMTMLAARDRLMICLQDLYKKIEME